MSNSKSLDLEQRITNSLRLGALGDRLGSWMEGVGPRGRAIDWAAGNLTDDTILTLATASAILEHGSADPASIAAHMAGRFRLGIAGLGATTLEALRALSEGQH